MKIWKKKINLDKDRMPKHIALIMDGNGRWATKRGLPRTAGHKAGAERMFDVIDTCKELGISTVTFYAFSTENWKRKKEEIDYIFRLLEQMLDSRFEELMSKNLRVKMIGTLDRLDGEYSSLKNKILDVIDKTKNNTGVTFNLAFNYGAHDEIVRAVKQISSDVKNNKFEVEDISEKLFETYLMTKDLPDIDLMIRTSGEIRLSNFLLWQLAYSELVFTKTYWPDFDSYALKKCLYEYQSRDRKFGNVK